MSPKLQMQIFKKHTVNQKEERRGKLCPPRRGYSSRPNGQVLIQGPAHGKVTQRRQLKPAFV